MFEKIVDAVTPFAVGLIILAGLTLANFIVFPAGSYWVGIAVIFAGILLMVADIYKKVRPVKETK
jgi:UDP-N-acetylmuramyl pentapeptide phosphotransferase/UDP-N-acetylglucosamine-1-phosphate transferase